MLAALGGVILIVLAVSGWRYHSRQRANESLAQLQKSWNRYETLRNGKDKDSALAYQEVRSEFEELIADFGDKPGGKLARVIFADICYDAGEADKAIALYKSALEDFTQPFYRDQILNGLGYAYEAKKEYDTALEYFEKISVGSDPVLKAEALFNMGRLYAALGNVEKSQRAYQKIVADSPQSFYAELAKERTGNIAAEPAATAN
jgi:tetratricopeptide (TPR) repeat protein